MPSSHHELNLFRLKEVAKALDGLLDQVVFVGGCSSALLVDPGGAALVRQTEDVDIIVDLLSTAEYYAFGDKLREKGFSEKAESDVLCRWTLPCNGGEILLDVMPTDENILGFSNRWYKDAIAKALPHQLEAGSVINVVNPTYFLATKLEAFHGRGKGDYYCHDFEDIIYVLEHRQRILVDLMSAKDDVKHYLAEEAAKLLHSEFENILPGLLNNGAMAGAVLNTVEKISRL